MNDMAVPASDTQRDAADTSGVCWDCGYSLRGLEEARCPECGRAFDPQDLASINLGRPMGPLARRLLRPAPWYRPLVYAYVAIALVVSAIIPIDRLSSVLLYFVGWLLLGVPYFTRAMLRHTIVKRYRQPSAFANVDDQMMKRVGRVTLCGALLLFARLPLYLALFISMPWLNALAKQRYEEMPFSHVNSTPLQRHQCGLFRVAAVHVEPSGAYFDLWQRDLYRASDLSYSPGRDASVFDYVFGPQLTPSWSVGR